ncbi:prepilin-type N-terminal cleavage/methylation domain-containing protein [Frisingicoccus sp.]|uniref:prepilin-type N-terminal cleavage/methylation domain-containing protein n=1 Tax=Frisingicoccus sp. TaxID=1918627 RepID=UPI003AB4C422
MLKKLWNKKNDKKGFTLVELIVVLIILAILAALLIPALTGYIDKAKEKQIIAETRQAVMAAQTLADEEYAIGTSDTAIKEMLLDDNGKVIKNLGEVEGNITSITVDGGKITALTYTRGKTCAYTNTATGGQYKVTP